MHLRRGAGAVLALCVACGSAGATGSDAATAPDEGGSTGSGDAAGADAPVLPAGDAAADGISAGVFDCALVAGDNCWKTIVAAAAGCLPPGTAKGTLSADDKTCTYPSGTSVTFASPLFVGTTPNLSSFAITTGGSPCLRIDILTNGSMTTTSAGAVSLTVDRSAGTLTLTCPGGEAFTGSVSALSACQNDLPGFGVGSGGISFGDASSQGVTVTLGGTGNPAGLEAFDCNTP
jgi:hypothetical protein